MSYTKCGKAWKNLIQEIEQPEFLSTHPSSKIRIGNIKKWVPLVKENY